MSRVRDKTVVREHGGCYLEGYCGLRLYPTGSWGSEFRHNKDRGGRPTRDAAGGTTAVDEVQATIVPLILSGFEISE